MILLRLKTLKKIDNLIDNNCNSCEYRHHQNRNTCDKCEIGKKIIVLGDILSGKRKEKLEKILKKGQDMTTDDVLYLVNNNVSRKRIAKSLGIGLVNCTELIDKIIGSNETKEKTRSDIVTTNKTNKEIVAKYVEKGLSNKEINKKTKIPLTTISTYRSRINREKKSTASESNMVKLLEQEVEELKSKLNETEEQLKNTTAELINMRENASEAGVEATEISMKYKKTQELLKESNRKISELEMDKKALENQIEEISSKAREEISKIKEAHRAEQTKHKSLLNYLVALVGE